MDIFMIVYWSAFPSLNEHTSPVSTFKYNQPEKLSKSLNHFTFVNDSKNDFRRCPAFKDVVSNTFVLRFAYDYNLIFDYKNKYIRSDMFDQEFYNANFTTRSMENGLYSLHSPFIFKTSEPLEVEVMSAYIHDNDFTKKSMIIPGKFDIGKWFRSLDCAFLLREGIENLNIKKDDIYCYIKFKTEENITFKRFYVSNTLMNITKDLNKVKDYNKLSNPLSYYYNVYKRSKVNNLIMKEIYNNIMDEV